MRLIDNWRDWPRFWSVRLQLAGTALLGFMEAFPNAFFSLWATVPAEVADTIPVEYIRYAGYAAIVAGTLGRAIRQSALHKADEAT